MDKRELLFHIYGYLKPISTYRGSKTHDLSYVSTIIKKYSRDSLNNNKK